MDFLLPPFQVLSWSTLVITTHSFRKSFCSIVSSLDRSLPLRNNVKEEGHRKAWMDQHAKNRVLRWAPQGHLWNRSPSTLALWDSVTSSSKSDSCTKPFWRENSLEVYCVSAHLVNTGIAYICSGYFFKDVCTASRLGEQCLHPNKRADVSPGHYKKIRLLKPGFLSCNISPSFVGVLWPSLVLPMGTGVWVGEPVQKLCSGCCSSCE